MAVRIDLADPSPEGPMLADGLRAAGYDVALRPIDAVPQTVASALVLAGDAEGALEALRALRDDGPAPDTPVVLLGTPPGTGCRGEGEPGFGAQAVLLRPIVLGRLIETIQKVLAAPAPSHSKAIPRRERTVQLSPAEETGVGSPASKHREPTVQLPHGGGDPLRDLEDLGEDATAPARPSQQGPGSQVTSSQAPGSQAPSSQAPGSQAPGSQAPGSQLPAPHVGSGTPESGWSGSIGDVRGPVAAISERLQRILAEADRRAFPGQDAIDLSLPGGDEPAAVLVPNELFEHDDLALDAISDEDPIDSFTFVGGPVLPSPPALPELPEPEPVREHARLPREAAARRESPDTLAGRSRKVLLHAGSQSSPGTGGAQSSVYESGRPWAHPPTDSDEHSARLGSGPPEALDERRQDAEPASVDTGVHEARLRPTAVASPRTSPRVEWPEEDSVLGRPAPDGGRRGMLGDGGALRLLLRIADLRLDARVSIAPSQGEPVSAIMFDGEAIAIEGPIALRAAAILRRRGARVAPADDESSAERALEHAIASGAISTYARDRALREAREQLLAEVVAWSKASFSLVRLDPNQLPARGPSPFRAPWRAVILEAARAIAPERARAILGAPAAIRVGPRLSSLAQSGLVAPELAALIERCDGASLDRLIEEAPDEPGLLGLVCGLAAADAIKTAPLPAAEPPFADRARHARRLVEDAARAAEEGDYFSILGVAPDAGDHDVERAFAARSAQLAALPLQDLGVPELEGPRREALAALEEAHRVLRVARWRQAYGAALAMGSHLAAPMRAH